MDIAIFPLQLIVFPGEQLNLHIFEPKYLQLIADLKDNKDMLFGIPPVINNQIYNLGTRLQLIKVAKDYENGEMDIITKGKDVFNVTNILQKYGNKLYAGAQINLVSDDLSYSEDRFNLLQDLYEEFQAMLTQRKEISEINPKQYSFQIAHYSGLNQEQKLALLATPAEDVRQEILINHFQKIMPSMRSIQETQTRITANGHFKNLATFNFNNPDQI